MEESNIEINEVCSNNDSFLKGENLDYPDYTELYNAGNKPVGDMEDTDRFFKQRPKYIFTYLENYIK